MKKNYLMKMVGAMLLATTASLTAVKAEAWKFGVISDTQWVSADDGKSPGSVPAYIIQQINSAFISQGVKMVIAVGDTIDSASTASLQIRALYTQDLYNAGIGFYPVRGNHEISTSVNSAVAFGTLFPQLLGGYNNNTPSTITTTTIQNIWTANSYDTVASLSNTLANFPPPTKTNSNTFTVSSNFSYPTTNGSNLNGSLTWGGLSTSFDYKEARFILIDQFSSTSSSTTSQVSDEQSWITGRLSDSSRPLHAFLFSHKNILGGEHKDNLFGGQIGSDAGDGSSGSTTTLSARQTAVDAFISAMYNNNARYLITGHDHHHKHSVVMSPKNSSSFIEQIISASDSNKFYTPTSPFSSNEVSSDEDLYEVGYYIYTVDGPRVTVDYYAVPANPTSGQVSKSPVLTGNWAKMLTFGYALNGQTFRIAKSGTYTSISDTTDKAVTNTASYAETGYVGSSFQILNGTNNSTRTTNDGRALTKAINTGWSPKTSDTVSDIAYIWGLAELGGSKTDTIKVALTFPTTGITDATSVYLATKDPVSGLWVNAVDFNQSGSTKAFSSVDYTLSPSTLGSYGVDLNNGVAWAVVNNDNRQYAVISTATTTKVPGDLNNDGKVDASDLAILQAAIKAGSTSSTYDLNGDGKVNSADSRWLILHYSK
jgi:hypothetical protein